MNYDLFAKRYPVCPYCKKVDENIETCGQDGESFQEECSGCEKTYHRETHFDISFSTVGDCEANGQMPHKLKKGPFESSAYDCINCSREYYSFQLADGSYPKLKHGEYEIIETEKRGAGPADPEPL